MIMSPQELTYSEWLHSPQGINSHMESTNGYIKCWAVKEQFIGAIQGKSS